MATVDEPLARLRRLPFAPGTNRRGEVSGAAWTFALPSQKLNTAVCLGDPHPSALSRLALLAQRVRLVPATTPPGRWREVVDRYGWPNVEVVADSVVHDTRGLDLVWLAGSGRARRGLTRPSQAGALLGAAGSLYRETFVRGRRTSLPLADRQDRLVMRLTPLFGEPRSAIPLGDTAAALHVGEAGLEEQWLGRELQRRGVPYATPAARIVGRLMPPAPLTRLGLLRSKRPADATTPPAYIVDLAAVHGCDLSGFGWALSAKAHYSSQKVLLFLYQGAAARPELVVKLTQRPQFNHHLENARRVLAAVQATQFGRAGRAPQVRFAGDFAAGFAVAERAVDGTPFIRASQGGATDPHLAQTVSILEALATETARRVDSDQIATALESLVARFLSSYEPEPTMADFVRRQPALLASCDERLPLVVWHGDVAPQNLIVRDDGQVAMLDWENGELAGMPLWDLFHFLLTYAVWSSRRRRVLSRLDAVRRHFVHRSQLTDAFAGYVDHYRRSIGLPAGAVRPLFWTYLAVQALREAPRLDEGNLASGHQFRLLRLLLSESSSAGLGLILGAGHDSG